MQNQKVIEPSQRNVSVHVLSWALSEVEQGRRVAIATIISAKGSVPGKPGAKLAINSRMQNFGTVGGAGLELKIEEKNEGIIE